MSTKCAFYRWKCMDGLSRFRTYVLSCFCPHFLGHPVLSKNTSHCEEQKQKTNSLPLLYTLKFNTVHHKQCLLTNNKSWFDPKIKGKHTWTLPWQTFLTFTYFNPILSSCMIITIEMFVFYYRFIYLEITRHRPKAHYTHTELKEFYVILFSSSHLIIVPKTNLFPKYHMSKHYRKS